MNETNNKQEEQKGEKVKRRTSLKNIIGGDILATDFFRRQTKLLVLIMVLILFYIHNRYACQQQMIEIDKLKKELIDIKYDALTRSLRINGTQPSIAYRGIHRNKRERFADFDQSAVLNQMRAKKGAKQDLVKSDNL